MPIGNVAVGSPTEVDALVEDQTAVHAGIEGRGVVVSETEVAVADGNEAATGGGDARSIGNAHKFIGAVAPDLGLSDACEAEPPHYPPIFHCYLLFG